MVLGEGETQRHTEEPCRGGGGRGVAGEGEHRGVSLSVHVVPCQRAIHLRPNEHVKTGEIQVRSIV